MNPIEATRQPDPSPRFALPGEACLFWLVVLAHLGPIWAFTYTPTQDGPAHLSSAIILRSCIFSDTRHSEFFEIRSEPIPNWSAQLLLTSLLLVLPPLLAEKMLVSAYILLLAGSLRFFCGAFSPACRPLALVGLLFIYNRCLWLGFFNFLFSVAGLLFILGYWIRRRDTMTLRDVCVLSVFLLAEFFTHLFGFFVTVAAICWLALTIPQRRLAALGLVAVAIVPAGLLAVDYLDQTRFVDSAPASDLWSTPRKWLTGNGSWSALQRERNSVATQLHAHHAPSVPLGFAVLNLLAILAGVSLITSWMSRKVATDLPRRWPIAVLAAVLAALYVLLPDDLREHGGFLKARLALIVPLLALSCLVESPIPALLYILRGATVLLIGVNLLFVTRRIEEDNRELTEYVAGASANSAGRVWFVVQDTHRSSRNRGREIADPLLHASQHYAFDGQSVNLDNYQAETTHFPLRFRQGVRRARGHFAVYRTQDTIDAILVWDVERPPSPPPSFRVTFRGDRLLVFERSQR